MSEMEELVDKYINKRLKLNNNNYSRTLGNVEALLSKALEGENKMVIKLIKNEIEKEGDK